ncbi:hypothetical protein ACFVWG_23515 [Kribbella sp. NPDC058245]|uniref:hypothetical protein n=1 Tax=Kribbella sp. NPDC058245 TaxID=3346399 RepID=UPI0036E58A92
MRAGRVAARGTRYGDCRRSRHPLRRLPPLAAPGTATAAVLAFVASRNNFMLAMSTR